MHTFLHKRFEINLSKCINNHNRKYLVAISSGQDSLCLLKLMTDCFNIYKNKLEGIYIDHQWRNNSKRHVQHIINIMNFKQIPVTIYQIKKQSLSENEARKERLKILIQHAKQQEYKAIITGHNNSDQIETVINNIIRGAGLNGVTSFTRCKKIQSRLVLIRPLINFSKSEIGWLCRLLYLPIWSDNTNYNLDFRRNRIRYELIPYLRNFFNPSIEKSLANFIKLCQQDNEYIKENAIKLYIKSRHTKLTSLNLQKVREQHQVLQERTIRLYFYYHFHKQIDQYSITSILSKENKAKIFCFNKIILKQYNNWLHFGVI